jgi:hypothetical protein
VAKSQRAAGDRIHWHVKDHQLNAFDWMPATTTFVTTLIKMVLDLRTKGTKQV